MKVLIVDDSKTMRMIVKRTLRQAGFGQHEVVEASNGAEALQSIEASKPDLVLSDWNMPEKNGLELLQALNEQNIDVPLGFVTSEGTPEMYRTATLNGARFLIAKPFTPDMFREHLSEVLQ